METNNPLNQIAIEKYKTTFTDDYWKKVELTEDQEEIDRLKRDALGILISQWCTWGGYEICEIFYSALEDSNFHTLNAEIEKCIERDKARR